MESPDVKWYKTTENIEYRINVKSGLGHILIRKGSSVVEGEPIKVFQKCKPHHYATLYVSHKNLAKPKFKNEKDCHLAFEVPEISLSDSIKRWNIVKGFSRKVISKFKIPYPVSDSVGEYEIKDGIEVEYLHPDIRQIFNQMFEFVNYVHSKNFSLTQFKLDDLSMKGEVVQFCGIGFVPDPNSTSRKMNFENVMKAIKVLLSRLDFQATSALKNLFSFIESLEFANLIDGQSLLVHLSILPPNRVLDFMSTCHDKIGGNKKAYAVALNCVDDCTNWNSNFLNEPGLGLVEECFFDERLSSPYVQSGIFNEDKISMYRFIRNMKIHLGEKVKNDMFDNGVKKESTIMYIFGNKLLDTQWGLLQMSSLHNFMV